MTCLFPENRFKHWMGLHASYTTYRIVCSFIKERPQKTKQKLMVNFETLNSIKKSLKTCFRERKKKLLFYCPLYAYLKRLFSQNRFFCISTSVYILSSFIPIYILRILQRALFMLSIICLILYYILFLKTQWKSLLQKSNKNNNFETSDFCFGCKLEWKYAIY